MNKIWIRGVNLLLLSIFLLSVRSLFADDGVWVQIEGNEPEYKKVDYSSCPVQSFTTYWRIEHTDVHKLDDIPAQILVPPDADPDFPEISTDAWCGGFHDIWNVNLPIMEGEEKDVYVFNGQTDLRGVVDISTQVVIYHIDRKAPIPVVNFHKN